MAFLRFLVIRLDFIIVGVSLPLAANDRFRACILV
jgi:hypothetical protein